MSEPSLGDIMAEIKQQKQELSSFVDNKIKTLQAEIHGSNLAVASDIKKLKSESEIEWKFKGNKIQYNFNSSIAELSSQVEWAIKNDKREYALELLNEVGEKLKERNKHLRIADSSPGDWDTVNNILVYQNDISILPDALKENADSTNVGYYRGFKKWSDWVIANGLQKNDALPAKPIVVERSKTVIYRDGQWLLIAKMAQSCVRSLDQML
ncbi:hypothetical protein KUTeg_003612 [Tegillarca granosa]|uniref:Uncharacterized protein n=1 Tax=Tegillarca granosa TaxID=220873 RepID=A0ABQ9FQU4_TEGGR|nr:hypothetical protein KUTeg_003612 [Tegillarca granosa]